MPCALTGLIGESSSQPSVETGAPVTNVVVTTEKQVKVVLNTSAHIPGSPALHFVLRSYIELPLSWKEKRNQDRWCH